METIISDERLKETLKEALIELMKERREDFVNIVSESLEDFVIGEAINEGLKTKTVSKEMIIKELVK